MEENKIDNPVKTVQYDIAWCDVKPHFHNVINAFPQEYKLIRDDLEKDQLVVFRAFVGQAAGANNNDRILYITKGENFQVVFEGTNQNNKISSYTEKDTLNATIENFTTLAGMSIKGTLQAAAKNATRTKVNSTQGIVQIITAIAAIAAIFYGMKACSM